MNTINNHIQIYTIWVNGRDLGDENQHYPITCNIESCRLWHSDFKRASKDFFTVKVKDSDSEFGYHSEIFKDFHVCLYSIDVNVVDFKKIFNIEFDLNDEDVQDLIPDYVNYNFNVVCERVSKFIK